MTQLRVIWPDEYHENAASNQIPRIPTLSEFYDSYVRPVIRQPRGRSDGTIEQDLIAIRHWKRITGDPPLNAITADVCAQFVAELIRYGLSPSTIRKTATHLQFILDHAGPADRRHRNAAEIISKVPYLERPQACGGDPEPAFTLAEIESLIEACKQLLPTSTIGFQKQPLWWASLIRFAWHTGLRRMNLLNVQWSWVDSNGWLFIPSSKYKQHKAGRRLYLSTMARKIAERVRNQGEDRIFAWNGSMSYFRKYWSKLTMALPEHRRFGTKAIRRATLTWLAERNPLVSRLVAGHRKLDVLEDFYVQRDVIVNLLETMPTPKGWDLE